MDRAYWREKLALAAGSLLALAAFFALARGEPLPARAEPPVESGPTATPTPAFRPLLPPNAARLPTATPATGEPSQARPALPPPGRSHTRTRTS